MMTNALRKFIKGWGFSFLISLLIVTSFKSAIADWNDIPSGSMEPTILVGDRVFVNKLAYDLKVPYTTIHIAEWAEPKRGDIVVFYSPENGKRLIKRVVGVPGDTIGLKQNRLFINGQFLQYQSTGIENEEPLSDAASEPVHAIEDLQGHPHVVKFLPNQPSLNTFRPITIPKGQYFMMGDNRDNSADSRYFGFVERDLIVGCAKRVAISRNGSFLNPRWDRFFKILI